MCRLAHIRHLIEKRGILISFFTLLQTLNIKVKKSSALLLVTLMASGALFIPDYFLSSLPILSLTVPSTPIAYSTSILYFLIFF